MQKGDIFDETTMISGKDRMNSVGHGGSQWVAWRRQSIVKMDGGMPWPRVWVNRLQVWTKSTYLVFSKGTPDRRST
jgi:hypothetical protein